MAELKCLIPGKEGCIIQDETAIVLSVTTVVAVALAIPIIGALMAAIPPPPPPPG